ncbi:DUF222 domain-containing protein, partial [Mycolicibacterium vaccae]|uniref:DUF222 domain-containing protein n=1 Tax=Mycolicibacterium vaccae TaxID=1810 RepID=UPI003D06495D
MFIRRTGLSSAADRRVWFVDPDAAVGAELGAALGISSRLGLYEAHRAVVLRDRLPQVRTLFTDGLITEEVVRTIIYRTELITDPAVIAEVDATLAQHARFWGHLSRPKIEQAIDATVIAHDPAAQRIPRTTNTDRTVEFGAPTDAPGITTVYARMSSSDATALQHRLNRLINSVCAADPRPPDERRDDALAAIIHGHDSLGCRCGLNACDAGPAPDRPAPNTT